MHSFNPRGRNVLIPCNVIDNCDCIPLNKNALGDVSLPPCPFCVILSILSNRKLKHLVAQEFSGNKDIRHLAETSFTNLNHFPYDYSVSNRLLEYLKYSKQILERKSSNMLPHFFHNDWHIYERHLHRFIFQVVGIPRSVFPILGQNCLFFKETVWKTDFCSASKPRQHFPTKSPSVS